MDFQNDAPIFKKIVDFYLLFHKHAKSFPKTERILFARIENSILDLLDFITTAGYLSQQNKIIYLKQASKKVDLLKILIRLTHESKIIKNEQYLELQNLLIQIGKMLGGWLKKTSSS